MVDRFKCRACGQITKDTDYYWKDRGPYLILKRGGLCEECERVGPQDL